MLIKDAKFSIDARKKQLIQQEANALKDAKLRGSFRRRVAIRYTFISI